MGVCVDSSYVVDLLRGHPIANERMAALEDAGELVLLPTPVLYEITSGLLYTRSRTEATKFRALTSDLPRAPFDEDAALAAADVRAELKRAGRTKGQIDMMIAGIAIAGGHRLLSRDKDFAHIADAVRLALEAY